MPKRSEDDRWDSPFATFVDSYGVDLLAARLNVTRDAIYKWVAGTSSLRLVRARKIQLLAKRRRIALSLDEIYQHFHEARGSRPPRTSSRKPEPARA
jgi:hypothetical protein